ncbi:FCD domain-containing protein [Streptomyces sp900116325]|uniref:FadR/GntR family transcriptional regulator n=1 Tax=Streptomyces sp. 900116325 TaxID=3154295 RepID=UPI0033D939BF
MRRAPEGEAAHLAATRATPSDLARMRQALAAIDAAVAVGGDGAEEDLAFHRSIAESTGNAVMVSTVRYLGEVLRSGMRVTRANEARLRRSCPAGAPCRPGRRRGRRRRGGARRRLKHAASRLQDAVDGFRAAP